MIDPYDALIQELSDLDACLLGRAGCGPAMAHVRRAITLAFYFKNNAPQERGANQENNT